MGKRRAGHEKAKEEFLYGVNSVTETLKAGHRKVFDIYVVRDKHSERLSEIESLAKRLHVTVTAKAPKELSVLSGTEYHQGVVARVGPYHYSDLSDLIERENGSESPPFLLMLDSVEDPQNFGALARTALCAGVDGIILPKDRSVSATPSASRASAGALEHLTVVRETNLVNTIKELKKLGYWIAGLDADGDSPLYETDLTMPLCVVVGGEGRGLRPLVRKQCDHILSIPQEGPVTSLNASVAGAIVMYEVVRQRSNQK